MNRDSTELMPCPCGERAFLAHVNCNSQVWCSRDMCWKGPIRETPAEAIAAWNTRSAQPIGEEMVERVRDAIWNELCPGIRRRDDDDEHYRRAARAAINAISQGR